MIEVSSPLSVRATPLAKGLRGTSAKAPGMPADQKRSPLKSRARWYDWVPPAVRVVTVPVVGSTLWTRSP